MTRPTAIITAELERASTIRYDADMVVAQLTLEAVVARLDEAGLGHVTAISVDHSDQNFHGSLTPLDFIADEELVDVDDDVSDTVGLLIGDLDDFNRDGWASYVDQDHVLGGPAGLLDLVKLREDAPWQGRDVDATDRGARAPVTHTPAEHEGGVGRVKVPGAGVYVSFTCGRRDVTDNELDGVDPDAMPPRRIYGPVFGPFDYVEGTYDALRVGPDGDNLAFWNGTEGDWELLPLAGEYAGERYSDWVGYIGPAATDVDGWVDLP